MPIQHHIHHDRRLVVARALGVLTDDDVFDYQRSVWGRRDVVGYDEIMDLRAVEHIEHTPSDRLDELAELSASMDEPGTRTRFAVIAADDLAYGLARMYEAYRRLRSNGTRDVAVFRSADEAMRWIGHADLALAAEPEAPPVGNSRRR